MSASTRWVTFKIGLDVRQRIAHAEAHSDLWKASAALDSSVTSTSTREPKSGADTLPTIDQTSTVVGPSSQLAAANTLDNPPQRATPRRESREFVRPPSDAVSHARAPKWPKLVTSKSPRKVSDFCAPPKAVRQRLQSPLGTQITSALSRVRVSPASPLSRALEPVPGPSRHVVGGGDKRASPIGVLVNNQQYVRVNPSGSRLSAFSSEDASAMGLPPTPAFNDSIKGRISSELPMPSSASSGPMGDEGASRPAPSLVPLVLSDIVQGVPFEKEIFGARIPGTTSTVVVQVEPDRFHASCMRQDHAGQVTFEWLDPGVPEDERLIDQFREIKHQIKTDTTALHRSEGFRNVVHQLEAAQVRSGKARPSSAVADDAYRIFTSEQAQRKFVDGGKASMSRRDVFDAERDAFDLAVYRTVLGTDLVFKTDGEWNIANPAGVADLKASLRESNFAFAAADTAAGRKVYFSLSGGARADGLKLAIHDSMGDADEISIKHLTFIDAKRRMERYTREASHTSSQSGVQMNLPVLDPECNTTIDRRYDADQILAAVIAYEAREHPVTGSIHFNTLLDTCDSSAGALGRLQSKTQQPVSVVYHGDYGVTTANSRNPAVRALQVFSASINELHGHLITGNFAQMYKIGRRLPTPAMMSALTDSLLEANGSYTNTAQLGIYGNSYYLRLLGVLTRTEVVRSDSVTDALLSPEGRAYVSMLGRRVAANPMLARAWASLLHELKEAGVPRDTLLEVLLSKPSGSARCFYVELLRAPHLPRDGRDSLVAWLDEAELVPGITELLHYVSLHRTLTLATRLLIQIQPAKCLDFKHVTLKAILSQAREVLSLSALDEADNQRLANRLREAMPTITIAEQREFREMIHDTLKEEWHKVLPDTAPPSHIAQTLIEDLGPWYERALIDGRKAAVDAIITRRTAAYADFQQRNPSASQKVLQDVFDAQVREARKEYRTVLSGASDTASENLTTSASQAVQSVKTALAKQQVRQQVEEAAKATRSEVATTAKSQAEQASSSAAKYAAEREAKNMALDAARAASLHAYNEASKEVKKKVEAQVRIDIAAYARYSAAKEAKQSAQEFAREFAKKEAAAKAEIETHRLNARLKALRADPRQVELRERLNELSGLPTSNELETRFAMLRAPDPPSSTLSSRHPLEPAQ
ncbi:hypothetical protein [Pandoraea sp. NPDC090278]|uniref:hypothetical protein n=1 Tax=Pandoraea sp. NPDC090278 TaxID=3364391 RepID=UPI00383B780A